MEPVARKIQIPEYAQFEDGLKFNGRLESTAAYMNWLSNLRKDQSAHHCHAMDPDLAFFFPSHIGGGREMKDHNLAVKNQIQWTLNFVCYRSSKYIACKIMSLYLRWLNKYK